MVIALLSGCLFAADDQFAGDYEKLNGDYRTALDNLRKRAVAAADSTTAKRIQNDLERISALPPTSPKTTSGGNPFAANAMWQGNVTVKKERDINNYPVHATITEYDAAGFTLVAKFLDREWIYKFKKDNNKLTLLTAEAKSGAGITKGITKIYENKIEAVMEEGKESLRIHVVRKDGTVAVDAQYDLKPVR